MEQNIKLIATDLDGTLFYPKRRRTMMTSKNKNFLSDCIDKGIKVVVVSSRNWNIIKPIEKRLGHEISMIGCNGGFIYDEGKIIEENPMNGEVLTELYTKLKSSFGIIGWVLVDKNKEVVVSVSKANAGFFIKFGCYLYNALNGKYREEYIVSEKEMIKRINNKDGGAFKLMAIFGLTNRSANRAHEAYLATNKLFGDKLDIVWLNNALEITDKGVNKTSALTKLINKYGINKDEVIVVGDSGNDISLLENFENSFVMSHANIKVKSKAKYVIKRVSDIKKYL